MMDENDLARAIHLKQFGHLERRYCTKDAPMPPADKDRFMWGHPDAVQVGTFFNLYVYKCPYCAMTFRSFPP